MGNTLAVTHGGYSAGLVTPLAQQFEDALRASAATPGWLLTGQFDAEIEAWAYAEAGLRRVRAWVDSMTSASEAASEVLEGEETEHAQPPRMKRRQRATKTVSALAELRAWETAARRARRELGLTPQSFGELARNIALTGREIDDQLAQLESKGRETEERRRRQIEAGYGHLSLGQYEELAAAGALPALTVIPGRVDGGGGGAAAGGR